MLYIYNPQKSVLFGLTVHLWLLRSKYACKYGFILDEYRKGRVGFYCDRYGISVPSRLLTVTLSRLFYRIEFKLWLFINNLNRSHRIVYNPTKLNANDTLFIFACEHLQSIDNKHIESNFFCPNRKFKIVCHLSHYCFRTHELAFNIRKLGPVKLVSEGMLDLRDSYFTQFFETSKESFSWIPFHVKEKFQSRKEFRSRKNVAIATGSFMVYPPNEPHTSAFMNYFLTDTLQPLRKEIWENRLNLLDLVDVNISSINKFWKTDSLLANETFFDRMITILYKKNRNLVKNWLRHYSGAEYYKQDIVAIYNDYKVAIVAEEIGDLPSIGAFEAMACGCAVLLNERYGYEKMGFTPNVDFIAYDGTLTDLLSKLRYYLSHQSDLEEIAKNGLKKVKKICMADNVMAHLASAIQ